MLRHYTLEAEEGEGEGYLLHNYLIYKHVSPDCYIRRHRTEKMNSRNRKEAIMSAFVDGCFIKM